MLMCKNLKYINLRLKIEDMSVSGVVQTKPVVESNEKLLNVWIKDLKNCYSNWKSYVCDSCDN